MKMIIDKGSIYFDFNSGGLDEGEPGLRDHTPNYYGAYIRDLDGNKIHIYTILN